MCQFSVKLLKFAEAFNPLQLRRRDKYRSIVWKKRKEASGDEVSFATGNFYTISYFLLRNFWLGRFQRECLTTVFRKMRTRPSLLPTWMTPFSVSMMTTREGKIVSLFPFSGPTILGFTTFLLGKNSENQYKILKIRIKFFHKFKAFSEVKNWAMFFITQPWWVTGFQTTHLKLRVVGPVELIYTADIYSRWFHWVENMG